MPIDILFDFSKSDEKTLQDLQKMLEDFTNKLPEELKRTMPNFIFRMMQLTLSRHNYPPILAALSGFNLNDGPIGLQMAFDLKLNKVGENEYNIEAISNRTAVLWFRLLYGYRVIMDSSFYKKFIKNGYVGAFPRVGDPINYQPINLIKRMFNSNAARFKKELETRSLLLLKRLSA